jgi:hypothetical protein
MRALGGGEGGIVDLARIKLCPGDDGDPVSLLFTPCSTIQVKRLTLQVLDVSVAMDSWPSREGGGRYVCPGFKYR